MTWRRFAVAVAVGGVVFAVWYGFAPGTLPAGVREPLDTLGVDRGLALAFAGSVAGVLGLLYAWLSEPDGETPIGDGPNDTPGRPVTVAGAELSARYERAVENGGPDAGGDDPLRRRLRAVVVESHRHEQEDHDAAEAYVDRGEWTDDRYAAAFLTTTTAVDYPWYHRLYAWLYPGRAYERRVERTLAAVEEACAERLSGYEAPPSSRGGRLRALRRALEGSS
ncbi:DUF7269 family protein [Haloplanus aerogenes]|nr:hypothetical protein ATH50_1418 [Haloplanus aerogenes]